MTSTKPIYRITLFKIPNVDDQQKLFALYKEMPTKAVKVQSSPLRPAFKILINYRMESHTFFQ